jgi:hypothetical protein
MTEITLFASTFLLVMLLGVQSLNVNGGHYIAAFLTSFGIGASNLVLFKLAPDANTTEMIAYMLGGPGGILAAMWLHPRMSLWFKRRERGQAFKKQAQRGRRWQGDYIDGWNDCRDVIKQNRLNSSKANANCGADRP